MPSGIGHFRWGRIALVLGSLYSFIRSPFLGVLLEDSPSGLWRTPGTRVGFTPSGVQIPHPPLFPRLRVFEVGDFCFWCADRFYCGVVPCVVGVAFRPGGAAF